MTENAPMTENAQMTENAPIDEQRESSPPSPGGRIVRYLLFFGVPAIVVLSLVLVPLNHTYKQDAAMAWAGTLLVSHLKMKNGQWPEDLRDLRLIHDVVKRKSRSYPYPKMLKMVDIDYDVDVAELKTSALSTDQAEFEVVTLKEGQPYHWFAPDPNQMLWEYFREQEKAGEPEVNHQGS